MRRLRSVIVGWCALGLSACYSVGFEPESGWEVLAVPVFRNQTLRRDVAIDLTRQVRRELLETAGIRLEHEADARRILRGQVVSIQESPQITGNREEVLHSQLRVTVAVGIYDPEGTLVGGADGDGDGAPERPWSLEGRAEFNTTRGETRETATAEAVLDLAEQVVFLLQRRVDDRHEPNDLCAEAVPLRTGASTHLIQREPDWFVLVVPPHARLAVTALDGSEARVTIALVDADDQPVGTHPSPRVWELPATAEERTVWLRVTGDDEGDRYGVWIEHLPPREVIDGGDLWGE